MAANLGANVPVAALDACHYAMLDRPREVAVVLNRIAPEAQLTDAEPGAAVHRGPLSRRGRAGALGGQDHRQTSERWPILKTVPPHRTHARTVSKDSP
jgi:hypothetical protein